MIFFTFLWYYLFIGSFITFTSFMFKTNYREILKTTFSMIISENNLDSNIWKKRIFFAIVVIINTIIWPEQIRDIIKCNNSNDY